VAIVVIAEPHLEVRALFVHVVRNAGYVPLPTAGPEYGGAEPPLAALIEPASADAVTLARSLRERYPELPVICVSIYPPGPEIADLPPAAYLIKPFAIAELTQALEVAASVHSNR
jgi:CheY-like chemotaxis protein